MKTSVLIPVHNEARHLPALFAALSRLRKKSPGLEILFIDNASTDGSAEMIRAAALPGSRLLSEPRRGFAEPLNLGVSEAGGDALLFLDADATPDPGWAAAMEKAFASGADLLVGQTLSTRRGKSGVYGRLAEKLFAGHSERSAHARGHALPWGPTCNLGVRRGLLERTGPFSPEATSAFDIDWCWRALLKGARIRYVKEAKVLHARRSERKELLEQFERYGMGEAWLHRSYAFLLSPEDREPDPLLAAVDAFRRLRHESQAARVKTLVPALEELAAAFAAGVRLGYERPHRDCPIERAVPTEAIAWPNGGAKASYSVFVPGKGIAVLEGKTALAFEELRQAADEASRVKAFARIFRLDPESARLELEEFRRSLSP